MNIVTATKSCMSFSKELINSYLISSVRMSASSWLLSADALWSAAKRTPGSFRYKLLVVNCVSVYTCSEFVLVLFCGF